MRLWRSGVVLLILLSTVAPAPAVVVVASPSNEYIEYFATPVAVAPRGGPLYLLNADGVAHSVVSFAMRADGSARWCSGYDPGLCPLFWSEPRQEPVTDVEGLAQTPPGEYPFYCGVHLWMRGTLNIVG